MDWQHQVGMKDQYSFTTKNESGPHILFSLNEDNDVTYDETENCQKYWRSDFV